MKDKYDTAYDAGYCDGLAGRVRRPPTDDSEINYRDGYIDGAFKRSDGFPDGAWPMRLDESIVRRQETIDLLDESGAVELRAILGVAAVAGVALLLWLLWQWILTAGVLFVAWRHLTRHTRRRRPKSSWSSLGKTGAMLFAAWNSRWLKPSDRRVTVPKRADFGGRWDQ